ncbi:hypothetical protein B0O80DRAFT_458275 [Mortierella sp. GBAus27b]|nr:hypothetical protein B0O80DRAFT_458275 [Mortierella sp. GBAus27b]
MMPSVVRARGRTEDSISTTTCTSPMEGNSSPLARCPFEDPRSTSNAGGASYLDEGRGSWRQKSIQSRKRLEARL